MPTVRGSTQRPEKLASKQTSAGGSQSKAMARIYALDHQLVSNSTKVVEGMILVLHCLTKVLSDPDTTHSFADLRFMSGENVRPIKLPYDLEVEMPTGEIKV